MIIQKCFLKLKRRPNVNLFVVEYIVIYMFPYSLTPRNTSLFEAYDILLAHCLDDHIQNPDQCHIQCPDSTNISEIIHMRKRDVS